MCIRDRDEKLGAPVVVIGTAVAEHYFPNLDPVGRELRILRFPFRIIGVLEKQGSVFGLNLDQQVLAPFGSQMASITRARQNLYGVIVQASTPAELENLKE